MARDEDLELKKQQEIQENAPEDLAAKRERAELALTAKEAEVGEKKDPILEGIESIDIQKPIESQPEAIANLEAVLDELTIIALGKGEKREELLKSPLRLQSYARTEIQKETVKKFNELFRAQPQAAISLWQSDLESSAEIHDEAEEEKRKTEKRESTESSDWMNGTLRFSLMAAGAFGAYKLWKYFTAKDEEKKGKDAGIGAALTALGVGALIGPETMGKWAADYLNLSIDTESFGQWWKHIKKGEFTDAFDSLVFNSRYPGIKKAADKLKITERTILDLKDVKWSKFNSFHGDLTRTGQSFLQFGMEAVGLGNLPGVDSDEAAEKAKEETKLQYFIKRNRGQIKGDIDKMSIGEILNELESKGLFGEPENPEEAAEEMKGAEGEPALEGKEGLAANFPHVAAALEGMKNGELDTTDGLAEIVAGTLEDGGAIAVDGNYSFLVKAGLALPLSNISVVSGQISDIMKASSGEGPWKNLLFEKEQIWWMGGYAAIAGIRAVWNGAKSPKAIMAAAKDGVVQGFIDSYLFIPRAVKTGSRAVREGLMAAKDSRYKFLTREHLTTLSPEQRIHLLHERAGYLGSQYKHYHETTESFEATGILGKTRTYLYEKVLGTKWIKKMKVETGLRYLEARKAFFEALGEPDPRAGKLSKAGITTGDVQMTEALAKSADEFNVTAPKFKLPKVSNYVVREPKFKTQAEATKAGVKKFELSRDLIKRAETLGLTNERVVLRLRELELTEKEAGRLLAELEAAPDPKKAAAEFETLLFAIKNPRLYRGLSMSLKAAGILAAIYMLYELQESKDKWNTVGETGSSLAGFMIGARTGVAIPLPHPLARGASALLVGAAGGLGGVEGWNAYGRPFLQENFPNRNEFFENPIMAGTEAYVSLISGGAFLDSALYAADAMGMGDGVDAETDPLKYLMESKYTWHTDYVKEIFEGKRFWPYGDHRMHDLDDLRSNGKEALKSAKEDLNDLEAEIVKKTETLDATKDIDQREDLNIEIEALEKKKEGLERAVLRFQSYTDDSWMDIKALELVYRQVELIEPAFQKFSHLVEAKFGADAVEPFTRLMQRMQSGKEGVKGDQEMKIWKHLSDEEVELGEGENLSFVDFTTFAISTYQEAAYLEEVRKVSTGESALETLAA